MTFLFSCQTLKKYILLDYVSFETVPFTPFPPTTNCRKFLKFNFRTNPYYAENYHKVCSTVLGIKQD